MPGMRRREFVSLFGGAAAWPLAARAQQPAMPTIAYLGPISPEAVAGRLRAFRQGLKEIGHVRFRGYSQHGRTRCGLDPGRE
jgi:putative ABC transport system substrate-binding protein